MDKAARRRWTVLLLAFAGTLVAIFYPEADEPAARSVAAAALAPAPHLMARPDRDDGGEEAALGGADPFAPRGWIAPPPAPVAPPPAAAVVAVAPVVAPPPPGAPPMPFRFVGRFDDGGKQVIYLARGDTALIARPGDTLEGTYKVLAISAQQIEFQHIPTGESQTLPIPAPDN